MPFRNMLVRMIYAIEPGKDTPKPFAEFRIFIITTRPLKWEKIFPEMERILDHLEWLMSGYEGTGGIMKARIKGRIYYRYSESYKEKFRIKGSESNVEINTDEAKADLIKTGLGRKAVRGEYYRFVKFFDKKAYNEAQIRRIIPPEIPFEEWITEAFYPEKELPPEELWE